MGTWMFALLLTGTLDCGSGARLETSPQLRLVTPAGIDCPLPPDVQSPVNSCAWHAPGRLLHVVAGDRQALFLVHCNKNGSANAQTEGMSRVRGGRVDAEHPWHFDAVLGEVYQEAGRHCDGRQFKVRRERFTPAGWAPAEEKTPKTMAITEEYQAVRGLPPGIQRRPWLSPPLPDVIGPDSDPGGETPSPVRLSDADAETAWVDEAKTPGTTLIYRLPASLPPIRVLSILPGHGGSETAFKRHARIKSLRIMSGNRVMRVRFPQDPVSTPGSFHVPWHVEFREPPGNCIEITIEELYPGENAAISEISLYTAMDFAPDPMAFFAEKSASWPAETLLRTAGGFSDAQLAQAWRILPPEQKRRISPEAARRTSPELVSAQLEMMAWADASLLSRLAHALARPEARSALLEKMKAVADAEILARLLPPYLAGGIPETSILDGILERHPELSPLVRDHVRAADRAALVEAWCAILPRRSFVLTRWAKNDPRIQEKAVSCLAAAPAGKNLQERMAFLRAASILGDRKLVNRVKEELRRPGPEVLRLQGIATLLHLQPTPRELSDLARTRRPDAQWMLLTHWPEKAPLPPEVVSLAKSPWPPVARQARNLLASRCHPSFLPLARAILLKPQHEDWFDVLNRVKNCGYETLRQDLLAVFARKGLPADAFAALAHVFALRGERKTAAAVALRIQDFFSSRHGKRFLEEHTPEGSRLLWALAAYERPEDTSLFASLARRDLPDSHLEILASILAARCRNPVVVPERVWRRPAEFHAFIKSCTEY